MLPSDPAGHAPDAPAQADDAAGSADAVDDGHQRVEAFLDAVGETVQLGAPVLLTRGARNDQAYADRRTLAWSLQGTHIALLHDGWLQAGERARLCDKLQKRGPLHQGGSDAMGGAPASIVWSEVDGQVRVWVDGTLRLDHDSRWIRIWRARCALVPRDSVVKVLVRASRSWDHLSVELRQADGLRREVVGKDLWGPAIDPGYDRAQLVEDAAWAVELADALASTFDVPVRLSKDLR